MALTSGRRPGAGTLRMVSALVRQRRRLALATVAIALGVGYLAGALTLLDRVSAGLDDLAAAGAERADLVVEGTVAYESALEQTRRLVPGNIVGSLREVPGVAAVVPRMEEITLLLDSEGTPLVAPGLSEQPLGTNWPDDQLMSPYRFVGEGRPPEAPDEVVIDEGSALEAGVEVGDSITVAGRAKVDSYRVVGIVTTAEGRLPAGATLALFDTAEARDLFDANDNVNRVAIRLEPGVDRAAVESQIRALLPFGSELVDGETAAEHRQETLTRSFALVRVLIMGFAGLALVVGMITVSNSLTLLYAERRRTLAAFRLVGAKPRQLMGAALIEAALLAAIASLIGAPLGLLLGRAIEAVLGALGTSVPVGGPVVSVSALATAVLVGAAATVLSAVMPARRACRVAPVEAVMEAPRDPTGTPAQRLLDASVVAIGVGVAVLGMLVLFDVDTRTALIAGGAATGLLVLAAVLPWALSSAVAGGILVLPLRPRTLRRIGARDAVRNRSRTAATTGALMLATAVVAGLAVFLSSFASSIDGDVDRLVTSDLVIDSGTFTRGGLPAELLDQTAELESVASVSGWQVGRVTVGQLPVRITAIDGDALSSVLAPGWVEGAPRTLEPDGLLLEQATAAALGVGVGAQVPVYFTSDGVETLIVAGIYDSGSLLLGEAVIDRSTLLRQVPASFDIAALVDVSGDVPAAREEISELARSFGVTTVLEPDEFVDRRSDLLHGFERVIQWMLFFTLIQALVGVVNTLLLSVGERRRQFGLLRAAGAGARQLHRLVLAEGFSFAVVGTLLGLALGIAGGAGAMRALSQFGISGVDVPVLVLLATAVIAIALGVAAAVVPARWAASVPPLEAVSDAGVASVRHRGERRRRRERAPARVRSVPAPVPVPAAAPRVDPTTWPPAGSFPPGAYTSQSSVPGPAPRVGAAPGRPAFGQALPPRPDGPGTTPSATPSTAQPAAQPAAAPPPTAPAPAPPAPGSPPKVSPPGEPATRPLFHPSAPAGDTPAAEPATTGPAPAVPGEPATRPLFHPSAPAGDTPAAEPATTGPAPVAPGPSGSWLRQGEPAAPAEHRASPAGPADPGADGRRPLFAQVPRSDAPPAPDVARQSRGWRTRNAELALDPTASARLADALERLHPQSVRDALPALVPLARALEPEERIAAMVQGWTKGLLCIVARTDRRIVVVVDRFPEPLVESLDPVATGIHLFGPPGTDHISVSVVDGHRLLELTGVRDEGEATHLQEVPARPEHVGGGGDVERGSGARPSAHIDAPEYF